MAIWGPWQHDKALEYCRSACQYSVSPGNFARGPFTIEEESMGALIKSGSRSTEGVLKVGVEPLHRGLWLLDSAPNPYWMQFGTTSPNDNEELMDLVACYNHIVFLVTGRRSVAGSTVVPLHKDNGKPSHLQGHGGGYGL